ncbi:MAG: tRNA (adenosine(37)-N6)-threonylcarbamoyltransferase complex dimerization subunit type 1 TsaB [Chthonomonadales bacterium]
MSKILAIETSADTCGICLLVSDEMVAWRRFHHEMHLSERILGDIKAVLEEGECSLHELTGIGVGVGPGSFTGVRIGVMTAKCLAMSLNIPLASVTASEALAFPYINASYDRIDAVIRARPDFVYLQRFDASGVAETDIELMEISEVVARITASSEMNSIATGSISDALQSGISGKCKVDSGAWPTVGSVARLAATKISSGIHADPLTLEPTYVSPPPIRN